MKLILPVKYFYCLFFVKIIFKVKYNALFFYTNTFYIIHLKNNTILLFKTIIR